MSLYSILFLLLLLGKAVGDVYIITVEQKKKGRELVNIDHFPAQGSGGEKRGLVTHTRKKGTLC